MSTLLIEGLVAGIDGHPILRGIDLEISSGEVHAVMGPNGAGKSTLGNVVMGHPSYEAISGSVRLDSVELLGLPPWRRAEAGLFLAPQDSTELPGVTLSDVLSRSMRTRAEANPARVERIRVEAEALGVAPAMLQRGLNTDASGGEKKRLEALQLALLAPKIALLDEIDSGLDVDALRAVAARIEAAVHGHGREPLGLLAITHYQRIFEALRPDFVHVIVAGRIVASGGQELAAELESTGYTKYLDSGDPR